MSDLKFRTEVRCRGGPLGAGQASASVAAPLLNDMCEGPVVAACVQKDLDGLAERLDVNAVSPRPAPPQVESLELYGEARDSVKLVLVDQCDPVVAAQPVSQRLDLLPRGAVALHVRPDLRLDLVEAMGRPPQLVVGGDKVASRLTAAAEPDGIQAALGGSALPSRLLLLLFGANEPVPVGLSGRVEARERVAGIGELGLEALTLKSVRRGGLLGPMELVPDLAVELVEPVGHVAATRL